MRRRKFVRCVYSSVTWLGSGPRAKNVENNMRCCRVGWWCNDVIYLVDRNEKSLWRKTFNLRGNTENEKSQRRQRSKRIVKTFSRSFPRKNFHTKPSSKQKKFASFNITKYWLLTIHRRKLFSLIRKESINVGRIIHEGVKRGFATLRGKKGLTRREKKMQRWEDYADALQQTLLKVKGDWSGKIFIPICVPSQHTLTRCDDQR